MSHLQGYTFAKNSKYVAFTQLCSAIYVSIFSPVQKKKQFSDLIFHLGVKEILFGCTKSFWG